MQMKVRYKPVMAREIGEKDRAKKRDENKQTTNSVVLVRERTVPTDRHLSAKLVPTFADRGCHVVSVTDPYGRILGF
jgi:CBS-domain-containing membrane protein